MSVYGGPEISNRGLVFSYDIANTQKSWKGAPATNLLINSVIPFANIYNFPDSTGTITQNYRQAPDGTNTAQQLSSTGTGLGTQFFTNVVTSTPSGTVYTFSFYTLSSSQTGWVIGGVGINQCTINSTTNISLPNGWYRWIVVVTTDVNNAVIALMAQVSIGTTIIVWGGQIELGSFATPLIPTLSSTASRSNTQAIVDITNNNTITATSLTYGSDGSFNFIGANSNYLTIGTTNDTALKGTTAYTVMGWINCSTSGPNGYSEFYMANSGGLTSSCINIFWYNNTIGFFTGTGSFYSYQIAVGTLSYNTWYHVTAVIDYTNSLFSVYLNGIYKGQSSFTTYTPAGTTVTIGKNSCTGNAGDYTTGRIPMLSVYNQTLSAEEILNNFNAHRGRFNI